MRVIVRSATYDYEPLRRQVFDILDALGGTAIEAGSRVLIKPNLLQPAGPQEAILTHPLVVRAVVEYCLRAKARPAIYDSPAIGSFEKILRDGGFKQALAGLDVTCRPFEASVRADIGPPFGAIDLAPEPLEADLVINLPKLKTHGQMLLTLGVKNLFGCVVGYRKPEWHLRAGIDKALFARLLVLISRKIQPALTLLDGVLALEGDGPGKGGTPREVGVLIGAQDPLAVDLAVCRLLGVPPEALPVLKAADELGFLPPDWEVDGPLPTVGDFRLPVMEPLVFGPAAFHGLARRYLLQRPLPDMEACKLCGECVKICPAQAIVRQGKALHFDYAACIRCYCCLEICPYGAIHKKDNWAARIVRAIGERVL